MTTNHSNYVAINAETALSQVRSAGNRAHGAQSDMAWALCGVLQQAHEGNLNPALALAKGWSEPDRKRAAKVLAFATSAPSEREKFVSKKGDLRISSPEGDGKPARLITGWDGRKMDWISFADFEALVLQTCPKDKKGEPKRNRASLRALEALVKGEQSKTPDTLESVEKRTVTAITRLGLPGVPEEQAKALIAEAFERIRSVSEQAVKRAEAQAQEATRRSEEAAAKRQATKARKPRKNAPKKAA